eukprot:2305362-Pleurochrysis_carterae.AAC.6
MPTAAARTGPLFANPLVPELLLLLADGLDQAERRVQLGGAFEAEALRDGRLALRALGAL